MRALLIGCAIGFAACSGQTSTPPAPSVDAGETPSSAQITPAKLTLTGAYVVPPFPGRDIAAGFFDITSESGVARLVAASSPSSRAIEIHTHIEDNGVMRMRPVASVEVGAGQTVRFKQGGYHLMLFGANIDSAAKTVEVTLEFDNAPTQTITMPVRQHNQAAAIENGSSYGSGENGAQGSSTSYGSGSQGSGSEGSGSEGSGAKGSGTEGKESSKEENYGSGK